LRALPLLGLLCLTVAQAAGSLQPGSGAPGPPLRLKTIAGDELQLDDYQGRTVIVNFWATWCAPCVAEMPSLQRLRDRLGPERVEVVAVNYQENVGRIKPFVDRLGITFPVVRDHDGSAREAWKVNVFPASFVIGPDRRIAWMAVGEIDWDDSRVESQVRNLR
jgi:thiol-disulfide isomerase/thioredoxin